MSPLIQISEICSPENYERAPIEHQMNMALLYHKICSLRHHSNLKFVMRTLESPFRGYRTIAEHSQLYDEIRRQKKLDKIHVPLQSMHLMGAAVDIYDPESKLKKWIMENLKIIEVLDLYFENFDCTKGWVHCQIFSPVSGNRFFIP